MGKSAPSAPPPPDYAGAARETAAGNLDAARANIAANRVNQITPYGNVTKWSIHYLGTTNEICTFLTKICNEVRNSIQINLWTFWVTEFT